MDLQKSQNGLNLLYTTDLHGDEKKYKNILKVATQSKIKLIHLGADILPKGRDIIKDQKNFITGFLKDFYSECKRKKITILAFFGNDDLYIHKNLFKEYGSLLDEKPYQKGFYEFKAYGYVPDVPFGLKTACKRDYEGWVAEDFFGVPVDISEKRGIYPIENLSDFFDKRGTIYQDLKNFAGGKHLIMATHCPPANLGLDICGTQVNPHVWLYRKKVGSQAVYNWIEKAQPKILLCGHIHESPEISNVWKSRIGDCTIIQPGQSMTKTTMVHIEIKSQVHCELIQI